MSYDFCIIGGGIVGLATALGIFERQPGASVLIIEKEQQLATHQTGHNSGVIHAGIYYVPGSLKAHLCRKGLHETYDFCAKNEIPVERCGKLIVATNAQEEERINALYERATANGLKLTRLNAGELKGREPHVNGVAALLSEETGIVDYRQVSIKMGENVRMQGGEILLGHEVTQITEHGSHVEIVANNTSFRAARLVVCGGLQADRLARLSGLDIDFRIVPFRGEYFQLPRSRNQIVRHLIYPAPDPSMPFLGVHLTRMIDGSVTVGPNAVLGLAREGYPKGSINVRDTLSCLTFGGFWRLIWKQRRHALHELAGSISKQSYLSECQKYCPELDISDLLPYRAGIRAQVVRANGLPEHDFVFRETSRMLHVCNAPSPAATSAIPIGRMIAEKCT